MKFHFPPTHPPSLSLEFSPYSPRPKSGSFTRFLLLRPSETAARSPSLSLSLCPDMPPYSPSPKSVSGVPLRSWVVSLPPLLHRSSPPSVGNRRPQPLSLCHTVPRPVSDVAGFSLGGRPSPSFGFSPVETLSLWYISSPADFLSLRLDFLSGKYLLPYYFVVGLANKIQKRKIMQ
jgi:hypothetical protein